MQVVLYNFVLSLSSAFVQYCLQECPYKMTPFPLPKPQPGLRFGTEGCQVCKAFPGSHVVILFARIFVRLRDDVGTGPGNAVALSEVMSSECCYSMRTSAKQTPVVPRSRPIHACRHWTYAVDLDRLHATALMCNAYAL